MRIYKVKDRVNREVAKDALPMIDSKESEPNAGSVKKSMTSAANWRKAARKARSKGNTPKRMFRRSSRLVSA